MGTDGRHPAFKIGASCGLQRIRKADSTPQGVILEPNLISTSGQRAIRLLDPGQQLGKQVTTHCVDMLPRRH